MLKKKLINSIFYLFCNGGPDHAELLQMLKFGGCLETLFRHRREMYNGHDAIWIIYWPSSAEGRVEHQKLNQTVP